MTFSGSVVAKTNFTNSGGSSTSFSSALNPAQYHVRLVDDVDLETGRHGREERSLPQVARVVDAAVAGGVDLDDVEGAGTVRGQADARIALPARVWRRALHTVQRAGQDARARCLTAAARPGEQVRVVHPPVAQRLLQAAR